jgi:hypothetical protein
MSARLEKLGLGKNNYKSHSIVHIFIPRPVLNVLWIRRQYVLWIPQYLLGTEG